MSSAADVLRDGPNVLAFHLLNARAESVRDKPAFRDSFALRIKYRLTDFPAGTDKLAHNGTFTDNIGIGRNTAGTGRIFRQCGNVTHTTRLFQAIVILQPLHHGDDIKWISGSFQ